MVDPTTNQQIELYISCRKLQNRDYFSKSDPYVEVYIANQGGQFASVGQTETIQDNLNPNFSKSFTVDYIFEVKQQIRFEVWDYDSPQKSDFLGAVSTQIGAIVGAQNQTLILDLKDKSSKECGKLIVRAEKVGSCREMILWQWVGVKLMNTDGWFGKSDPLLRFFKQRGNEWLKVHETETIMDNLDPIWKPFKIKGETLYGGDHQRPIRVECWDWEKSGKYQYIGETEFTMDEILNGKRSFELYHPGKKKKSGTLKINTFAIEEKAEFIDYIRGGEQLSVLVAIDFTGSNGTPTDPKSLHSLRYDGSLNEYQKAIQAVCEILMNYDYDKQVPVYGFGGKPRFPKLYCSQTMHCFPCTGNPDQQFVSGLQGIMDTYAYALKNVELAGPTLFGPLIKQAMQVAQANKQSSAGIYSILLILTDGEIHDMRETIELIIQAAELPLSIIIVGVGNSDFQAMEVLDGDKGLYNSSGKKAARDIVQFVPFRKFSGNQALLAQEVLAEIPEQLTSYMNLVGKKPGPAKSLNLENIMKPAEPKPVVADAGSSMIQNAMVSLAPTKQNIYSLALSDPALKIQPVAELNSVNPKLNVDFDLLRQEQEKKQLYPTLEKRY